MLGANQSVIVTLDISLSLNTSICTTPIQCESWVRIHAI